jgi:hypothetical protein
MAAGSERVGVGVGGFRAVQRERETRKNGGWWELLAAVLSSDT